MVSPRALAGALRFSQQRLTFLRSIALQLHCLGWWTFRRYLLFKILVVDRATNA